MDYVAYFKVATLEIYHLDEDMAMLSMKQGLCPSRFTFSLDKTFYKSYSELLMHIQKYIHATKRST